MTTEILPELSKECFGPTFTTPGVAELLPPGIIAACVQMHRSNNWGRLSSTEDFEENEAVVRACLAGEEHAGRIFSVYEIPTLDKIKVWVISYVQPEGEYQSKPDFCYTTVLLPSEY